jgi:hypothetical protein
MAILEDLLNTELTENNVRVITAEQYTSVLERSAVFGDERLRSPKPAKSLRETYLLIKQAIDNYQTRASTPANHKVIFTEEEPDESIKQEIITFSLIRREPGSFGSGAPFESSTKNLKMILREEKDDDENPGYKQLIYGYWHDNIIRMTCWAQTNKGANARAEWLENLLEEYQWFFKAEGVDRFLYFEQQADITTEIKGNKWYGRPLDFYVRTETIRTLKEKTIEEILINFTTKLEP